MADFSINAEQGQHFEFADANNNGETENISASNTTGVDPFSALPPEMLAEIFLYLNSKHRQQLRRVSWFWKFVVDTYYGICLFVTNINWNCIEDCNCAKTVILNGFSRDVLNPEVITSRLTRLEITDFVAYYSFMPLLEECHVLESLVINCVTFLQRSRLAEYSSSNYLERNGKENWLPRLKHFRFVSCTTQGGVYNHIAPAELQDEMFGIEDVSRTSYDLSRGEMEFLPFILQILCHAKSLAHVEMTLTDIWKIPFTDLLQVSVETPPASLDISLWHFGSKRLLPIGNLLQKVTSISSIRFHFPYHFDMFFMKFKPSSGQPQERNQPYQLEEVVVHQSFRWSQEMTQVDIPWLQILEKQQFLKTLEYPFPVFGNDQRMANIIEQNCKTLQKVVFTGHREEREILEDFRGSRVQSWNADWFACCEDLQELCLKTNARLLLTPHMCTITNLRLLPQSLKHFTIHGCIDSLVNLESFVHQVRVCPWFKVNGLSIFQLQFSHAMDIIISLPKLKHWTFEWYDTAPVLGESAELNSLIITSDEVRRAQSSYLSKQLLEWIADMKESLEVREITVDRHMKSLTVDILSNPFLNQ